MKRLFSSAAVRLLPVLLTLAACSSNSGNSYTPVPDQSQVMLVHSSYLQATNPLQFSADNTSFAQVAYGQSSGYIVLDAGSHVLKASGSTGTGSTTATLVKDKSYSFFAYPSAATGTLNTVLVPDDLTASTTMSRIRLVNFTSIVGAGDVKLARATTTGSTTTYQDVTPLTSSNSSSGFVDLVPGVTTLALLDASNNVLAQVGGTSVTKYQAGQIYTAVASGLSPTTNADYKLKVSLVVNK